MYQLGVKSLQRLQGVHPDLIRVAVLGIQLSPYDFTITEGVRDLARQKVLYAKGASKTMNSKHLIQKDGFAHAFDLMAVGDLDKDGDADAKDLLLTWDKKLYGDIAKAMYEAAKRLGVKIKWGGNFKGFYDGPHFQLEI
jgi:peptidoglycan L-alanyl-D-glutamate endopeptidase CwlK